MRLTNQRDPKREKIDGLMIRRGFSYLATVCAALTTGVMIESSAATANSVNFERGLYWERPDTYVPQGYPSRVEYLKAIGVSEVHIWLNDNEWDKGRVPRCQNWSYTDSAGSQRWTAVTAAQFVRELKSAGIRPIFTLSPQGMNDAYVDSLVSPDGPIGLARALGGIPIELDLEGNWRTDRLVSTCGRGDVAEINRRLIDAIRDVHATPSTAKPLSLIVSATRSSASWNRVLLEAADILAPQLYDRDFALTKSALEVEMKSFWLGFRKPIIAAVDLACGAKDAIKELCSRKIFEDGVNYLAGVAQCGTPSAKILSYVLWSQGSGLTNSTFGRDYVSQTANIKVPTDCP